jgi:thymidylate synthase (FAD)
VKVQLFDEGPGAVEYVSHTHSSANPNDNIITFKFTVPIFVRSQHHLERTWSYNEINTSRDECELYKTKTIRRQGVGERSNVRQDEVFDPLIDPENMAGGNAASYLIMAHNNKSLLLYQKLVKNGVCREQARSVLPRSTYVQYYGTTNLKNLVGFVTRSMQDPGHLELQLVARACLKLAESFYPELVRSYLKSVSP